jgi:putative radical SAM enzyme (TIGR03279 family)
MDNKNIIGNTQGGFMAGKISGIVPDSIAEEIGIEPGDTLLTINDNPINDLIDYNYYEDGEYLELTVEKENGEVWVCEVEKFSEEELGLIFEANVFNGIRPCHNHCPFCFVDQLQPHPRSSLLLKDDDYRMSFLEGNFITCTNLAEDDYKRIGELRLSPLYISVHTVDPLLRQRLLGLNRPAEILLTLQRLIAMGCRIHTQIVLCPGINDGRYLDETLDFLTSLALGSVKENSLQGGVLSVAVVPVGLTRFQKNQDLRLFTPAEAAAIIDDIEKRQQKCLDLLGGRFIYAADELYLKAGRDFPAAATYEDFPQIENGVGMAAQFIAQWQNIREILPKKPASGKIAVITGKSGAPVLRELIREIKEHSHSDITLVEVANTFYGDTVTATGLLTGSCIINAIAKGQYQRLLIPANMLKFDEDIFLDDMTTAKLAKTLAVDVRVIEPHPAALLKAIFNF